MKKLLLIASLPILVVCSPISALAENPTQQFRDEYQDKQYLVFTVKKDAQNVSIRKEYQPFIKTGHHETQAKIEKVRKVNQEKAKKLLALIALSAVGSSVEP